MFQGDLVLDLIIKVITGDGDGSKKSIFQLFLLKIFLHPEYSSIQVLEHSSIQVQLFRILSTLNIQVFKY